MQEGFSRSLAPKKLYGKLLNLFDSAAHRVVGGLSPPAAPTNGTVQVTEHHQQSVGPRVSASQSALAMSSIVPSQSTEHINEWAADSNRMTLHTRSVSEPDFGRSPRQVYFCPSAFLFLSKCLYFLSRDLFEVHVRIDL